MPRVIRRTVEPAKLLACQSVEKRCTRQKASWAISTIILVVSRTMPMNTKCLSTSMARPSPTRAANASRAASSAAASRPPATASTSRPAKTGISTSVSVWATTPAQIASTSGR